MHTTTTGTHASVRERLVRLLLTVPLWLLLGVFALWSLAMTGWSLGPSTATEQLLGDLPFLALSTAAGVGMVATLLWAGALRARWPLVLGAVPAVLRASAVYTGAY